MSSVWFIDFLRLPQCDRLTDLGLSAMLPLTNLTYLGLERMNGEAGRGISSLKGLRRLRLLRHLDVRRCLSLRSEGIEPLQNLVSLTRLDMEGCASVSKLPSLRRLTGLTSLNLSACTSLTNASLAPLRPLTALVELGVSYCVHVTARGLMTEGLGYATARHIWGPGAVR